MSELYSGNTYANYLLPLAIAMFLLIVILLYRRQKSKRPLLSKVLSDIAFARIDGLVIPSADGGEIQIDHLLLTAQGLLIIDIKDVKGAVFGSDKMQEWTVINEDRRFTFANPQPSLFDRIAAVRQIVHQVPVAGRILFLEGAEFTKGVPDLVCSLDELLEEYSEKDKSAAKIKVGAFRQHWDVLHARAIQAAT